MKTNSIISNMIHKGNGSTRNVVLNFLYKFNSESCCGGSKIYDGSGILAGKYGLYDEVGGSKPRNLPQEDTWKTY